MAVVIGRPNVAQLVEPAFDLLAVIRDVRQQIGGQAVDFCTTAIACRHPTEPWSSPHGVVVPIDEAGLVESCQGTRHLAAVVQGRSLCHTSKVTSNLTRVLRIMSMQRPMANCLMGSCRQEGRHRRNAPPHVRATANSHLLM